jgi:hypothetical protein
MKSSFTKSVGPFKTKPRPIEKEKGNVPLSVHQREVSKIADRARGRYSAPTHLSRRKKPG